MPLRGAVLDQDQSAYDADAAIVRCLTRTKFWLGSPLKMVEHRQSEAMNQFRERVPIAMDVGSGMGAAIAINCVARGRHMMASAVGSVIDIGSTLAIASAWPATSENDADQGEPHRLRRS
jgi:hypothetical protein